MANIRYDLTSCKFVDVSIILAFCREAGIKGLFKETSYVEGQTVIDNAYTSFDQIITIGHTEDKRILGMMIDIEDTARTLFELRFRAVYPIQKLEALL